MSGAGSKAESTTRLGALLTFVIVSIALTVLGMMVRWVELSAGLCLN